jgi:hypothetical protein
VSASAIRSLSNFDELAAPFAAAYVSASKEITRLGLQYRRGEIEKGEAVELLVLAGLDSSIVAMSTVVGQTVVPIPILGAVLGAAGGRLVAGMMRDNLAESERELIAALDDYSNSIIEGLDAEYRAMIDELDRRYGDLADLQHAAFDLELNASIRFGVSIDIAQEIGVSGDRILESESDVDSFFTE